jgi:dethiobiotin synthetase
VKGLFVTATDTGVGKTVVTAGLARAFRAHGWATGVAKPVQSGNLADDPAGDAMLLRRWAGLDESPAEICPYAFRAPLAPLIAARLEGRSVELDAVVEAVHRLAARHDLVLVEGAGGLLVPVGEDRTIADLAARLALPLLVVGRAGLGTVNHTLLTLSEARRHGLEVVAVVLNGKIDELDRSCETNAELIESFGEVAVIGEVPWIEADDPARLPDLVAEHIPVEPLLTALEREEATRA